MQNFFSALIRGGNQAVSGCRRQDRKRGLAGLSWDATGDDLPVAVDVQTALSSAPVLPVLPVCAARRWRGDADFLGCLYRVNKSAIRHALERIEPLARRAIGVKRRVRVSREESEALIIDCTEPPIQRPADAGRARFIPKLHGKVPMQLYSVQNATQAFTRHEARRPVGRSDVHRSLPMHVRITIMPLGGSAFASNMPSPKIKRFYMFADRFRYQRRTYAAKFAIVTGHRQSRRGLPTKIPITA